MDEAPTRSKLIATIARKRYVARNMMLADLLLAAVCWVLIGIVSLRIAILPLRRILRSLGDLHDASSQTSALDKGQQYHVQRIARAVAIAANNAPFRADCYPQALVAAQLCRWWAIPYAFRLGVRFAVVDGEPFGKLEGHAWVCSGALTICGGPASDVQFGTVACFVYDSRRGGKSCDRNKDRRRPNV